MAEKDDGHHVHATHPEIVKRLKRAHGHLARVIAMIEEERPCLEVAQQLQAVSKAVINAKNTFVHDHIEGCLNEEHLTTRADQRKAIAEFREITKYLT